MSDRLRYALFQGLMMAAIMFVFRRIGDLLPVEWMSESWSSSLAFAVPFGLVWGVMSWFMFHREQARRSERERRDRERRGR